MKGMAEILSRQSFAEGLEESVITLISGCAKNVVWQAGEYIFRSGDAADYFYLIRHGGVALETAAPGQLPYTFLTIKGGEVLGASWLVAPYRYRYDARAMELTRALAFDAGCLREKCDNDHHVGYEMMKRFVPIVIGRLQSARLQSLDIYASNGPPRES